jgi:hypothetical protein
MPVDLIDELWPQRGREQAAHPMHDPDSRTGARLWAALIARGCVDEATSSLAADAYAGLTAFVVRSRRAGGARLRARPDLRPGLTSGRFVLVR